MEVGPIDGDVIERVPGWVVVVFAVCVLATWLPSIRFAQRTAHEVVPLSAFFGVVASFAGNSPALVIGSVLVFAAATAWVIVSTRPWRRTDRQDDAEASRRTQADTISVPRIDGYSGRHRTRPWLGVVRGRR